MHKPADTPGTIARDNKGDAPTPMIAQYIEIKAANPDCLFFYRMGDFYELFFEDSVAASRALGIMLTKRGKHRGEDIPMCGVPVERANDYLQKLIALGHRVAVCEQLEDPAEAKKRGAKSVVRRDVTRLVTPGTITEETLLDPARPNAFAALARARGLDGGWLYGLACVDISTGAFTVVERAEADLSGELARLEPREIVVAETLYRDASISEILSARGAPVTPLGRDTGEGASAERRLMEFYGVATLGGLWRADAGRACRLRLRDPLCRAHAKGRAPGAGPALEPARQQDARHRRRDPGQSRNLADALRRARGVAALRRRSHGDAGRGAAAR